MNLAPLLRESLAAWRLAGEVCSEGETIVVISGAIRLEIGPAPPELPFRWLVTRDGRQRGAGGIAGVLRAVRVALDPDYAANRLQIAPQPVLPG